MDCFKSCTAQPYPECAGAPLCVSLQVEFVVQKRGKLRLHKRIASSLLNYQYARMSPQAAHARPMSAIPDDEHSAIVHLFRRSSIEMSVHDLPKLPECRALLPGGLQLYISHLPGQGWQRTIDVAAQVRAHGFEPVPHLPVRKLASEEELQQVLEGLSGVASVKQVLLIAGDVKEPQGPFTATIEVMNTGLLDAMASTR